MTGVHIEHDQELYEDRIDEFVRNSRAKADRLVGLLRPALWLFFIHVDNKVTWMVVMSQRNPWCQRSAVVKYQ